MTCQEMNMSENKDPIVERTEKIEAESVAGNGAADETEHLHKEVTRLQNELKKAEQERDALRAELKQKREELGETKMFLDDSRKYWNESRDRLGAWIRDLEAKIRRLNIEHAQQAREASVRCADENQAIRDEMNERWEMQARDHDAELAEHKMKAEECEKQLEEQKELLQAVLEQSNGPSGVTQEAEDHSHDRGDDGLTDNDGENLDLYSFSDVETGE